MIVDILQMILVHLISSSFVLYMPPAINVKAVISQIIHKPYYNGESVKKGGLK